MQRVTSVVQYCKEVLQYYTTEYCSTDTHLLLLCRTTCITSVSWMRKMPSRSPCPKAAIARGRRPALSRPRQATAPGARSSHSPRCASGGRNSRSATWRLRQRRRRSQRAGSPPSQRPLPVRTPSEHRGTPTRSAGTCGVWTRAAGVRGKMKNAH